MPVTIRQHVSVSEKQGIDLQCFRLTEGSFLFQIPPYMQAFEHGRSCCRPNIICVHPYYCQHLPAHTNTLHAPSVAGIVKRPGRSLQPAFPVGVSLYLCLQFHAINDLELCRDCWHWSRCSVRQVHRRLPGS